MKTDNFTLTGATGTYRMNFGTNAACRVEEALKGKSFLEAMAELRGKAPSITMMRLIFQVALVDPQNPSADDAGRIIDDLGGWDAVLVQLEAEAPEIMATKFGIQNAKLQLELTAVREELAAVKASMVSAVFSESSPSVDRVY